MNQSESLSAQVDPQTGYFLNIEEIRDQEYPSLANTTYLDHAGTALYARSLIEAFSRDLSQNLFGNPHSASASSQLSSRRIEDTRLEVLRFFNASPDDFEVVFVANATAAIKLVADTFRDNESGFWYGYHFESHTSLVGVRELATRGSRCFFTDDEVDSWLNEHVESGGGQCPELSLLAYPGQSNMTGRRLLVDWCQRVNSFRKTSGEGLYTLFDAAALVSTSPLDLSDPGSAPDFIATSFYKIFGFPDLGALLVRKDSAGPLRRRRYFGGGTVDSVSVLGAPWHAKKHSVASLLEDGTLPFHSILALQSALKTHRTLYGSMHNIARHTDFMVSQLEDKMQNLKHGNGRAVCLFYTLEATEKESHSRGPVLAFNLLNNKGECISTTEVEKLAIVNNIQFRTGGLCNPGGLASHLRLTEDELRQNYASGFRCGGEQDIVNGKPTGTIRVSLGAMSSLKDVSSFKDFLKEYYIDASLAGKPASPGPETVHQPTANQFVIESLSVFPIKSCAAFKIPPGLKWQVGSKGLTWDREWCLVHEGTHVALSQKRYPRMALLYPSIDLEERRLRVTHNVDGDGVRQLSVGLGDSPLLSRPVSACDAVTTRASNICGETVDVEYYTAPEVAKFFTDALGVPCTLARFPKSGPVRRGQVRTSGSAVGQHGVAEGRPVQLSNESPILLISRSSVNRLNEEIKHRGGVGKTVSADSFRGNILIAETLQGGQHESPYAEDDWEMLQIGADEEAALEVLGPCQRCQMVCVDQRDASRRREPFSTLSKTRRRDGRVWFGMHMSLTVASGGLADASCHIQVGDRVTAS
jgi:molybdenum cofactor sulfurtransferase